jgi:hypothetical protein
MSTRHQLAWLLIAAGIVAIAWFPLNRVENAKLFLFALPFDRNPFSVEFSDAAAAARTWKIPALVFLAVVTAAIALTERSGPVDAVRQHWHRVRGLLQLHPRLSLLLALASAADFVSTLLHFQNHRIDDELHPGIKLVTYAFGLSLGCLIGKAIQAVLALLIGASFPKVARPTLVILIVAYTSAAVWNLLLE